MRKQQADLFIPLIPSTAVGFHSTIFPSQRSHERFFLKNVKGVERIVSSRPKVEVDLKVFKSSHIDTGMHGLENN